MASVLRSKFFLSLVGITAFDITAYAFYYVYMKFVKHRKRFKPVNEVLLFHSGFIGCNSYCKCVSGDSMECSKKSFKRIMSFVESSQTSLDVCYYFFTSFDLAEAIVNIVKHKQVAVRIIVDSVNEDISSQISHLITNGIHVKVYRSQFIMHHKFMIIDQEILICGSSNFTAKSMFANLENVLILSKKNVVKAFLRHFNEIWETVS